MLDRANSSSMGPLSELLQTQGCQRFNKMSGPWRLSVARQICSALSGLHGAGKSHGSLAPRNIWVGPGPEVILVEAGLVDALLGAGVLSEADLLACLGLEFARYIAPEGWQVPRQGGPAADSWALGLVLLEVLGEMRPPNPDCNSLRQLAAKVLPKRGQHSPQLPASLPEATRHIIQACLSASPDARPDVQQVLLSLAAPAEVQAMALSHDAPAVLPELPPPPPLPPCTGPRSMPSCEVATAPPPPPPQRNGVSGGATCPSDRAVGLGGG